MAVSVRTGRDIPRVSDTQLFLMFRQERPLRFQPWLETQLLPTEGRRTGNPIQRERNASLNWFTYYFCFQQQKAENCKKQSEKSAEINAESKKLSDPYQ